MLQQKEQYRVIVQSVGMYSNGYNNKTQYKNITLNTVNYFVNYKGNIAIEQYDVKLTARLFLMSSKMLISYCNTEQVSRLAYFRSLSRC